MLGLYEYFIKQTDIKIQHTRTFYVEKGPVPHSSQNYNFSILGLFDIYELCSELIEATQRKEKMARVIDSLNGMKTRTMRLNKNLVGLCENFLGTKK